MSPPVLIGFAGVLVAAVTIGMLGGRCVRQPRLDLIAWTAATVGLTVALAAMSVGFASGFGSGTFRAVQLFGLLLAPLWLAWGLVELVAQSEAGRFAMRLAAGALTAVGGVILATDPLTAQPFGKSWPVAGLHYQAISHYVLDLVQLLALVTALASLGVAAARARNDPQWLATLTGSAVVGLAVLLTDAMRFSLPARSTYPLLGLMAAGLVWFGGTRLQDLPGRAGRAARADRDDRGDRDERAGWADDGYAPRDRYEGNGHSRRWDPRESLESVRPYAPVGPDGAGWAGGPGGPAAFGRRDRYAAGADGTDPDGRPLAPREMAPREMAPREMAPREMAPREMEMPQPPALAGAPAGLAGADGEFGQYGKPAAASPGRPYGRIVIFTLLEDRVADFDRLAEQTAEEVRTAEPDTLVYVIHLVPNAPMQRIFYEIYRDRDAFDTHEHQPYMQRFVAERRSCVLATNVIELRLKYAKVAPLPHSQPAEPMTPPVTPPAAPGQLASRPPAALPPLPAAQPAAQPAGWSPGQVQTLEPLPPGPDRRRTPSAGRPYDGP
jgi:quinol monooxygenase YgiN